ncbi:hypothetical protein B1J92_L10186g [Nakaseomyces glabratus]|nr:hypothetical protein B1J91_L10186g [Nakaseomyces glabratus]OXB46464.1 hypothetical protein B1J92_L10186g [Nakaseomyces glabratus]
MNTKEEEVRVEEAKKGTPERVESILNGDQEENSSITSGASHGKVTPMLLKQLSSSSFRSSISESSNTSITSLVSTTEAKSPGSSGSSTSTKVGKKSSGLKKKKKKNQCYFDKCTSVASKFVGDCNFCKGHYCSRHRLMENHACGGLTSCKEQMHQRNADKLASEQTHTRKIQI